MHFTKSIVATALALFASSAVATTVDIAYTSNGGYYKQQVESDVRTSLTQPYVPCHIKNLSKDNANVITVDPSALSRTLPTAISTRTYPLSIETVETGLPTNINRYSYYGQEIYYVAAGVTNIDPPVYAAYVQCEDPSA
ncbi:hypothetical protein AbraIFM66950_009804 [Aspergillus brasiliensis]|nr:hypothetical protein AbraIFM66950_009804 [Aspergillus brasiliensis]